MSAEVATRENTNETFGNSMNIRNNNEVVDKKRKFIDHPPEHAVPQIKKAQIPKNAADAVNGPPTRSPVIKKEVSETIQRDENPQTPGIDPDVKLIAQLIQVIGPIRVLRIKNTSDSNCFVQIAEVPHDFVQCRIDSNTPPDMKTRNSGTVCIEAGKYIIYHTKKDICFVNGYNIAGDLFWLNRRVQLFTTKLTTLSVMNKHLVGFQDAK